MARVYKKKKHLVAEKCNWRCGYCGVELTEETLSIDHVIPRCKKGNHDIDNLLPCCQSCNSSKGTKSLEEYRLFLSFKKAIPTPSFNQVHIEFLRDKGLLDQLGVVNDILFFFEDMSNE